MATQFPEFREDKDQIVPPGRYVWTWQHPSGIWFHLLLVVHWSSDKFTLEGAWDFQKRLPGPARVGMGGVIDDPQLFRPNFLWSGKDYWWPLVLHPEEFEKPYLYNDDPIEECLPLVAPAVWDAADKIKEHILPAFERIVQKHEKAAATRAQL